jgi:membrane peptidoglycan carboxypeptidase
VVAARRLVRFRPWMVAPAILLAILLVVLPGLLYVWAGLPSTSNLSTARLPLSTRIYDRTGTVLLAEIHQGSDRRHIVPLSEVRRCGRRPSRWRTAASISTAA